MSEALELAALVSPLEIKEFLSNTFGRAPYLARGTEGRFNGLVSWSTLNDILSHHRLEWPRLRLADGGEPVRVEEYSEEVTRRNGPSYRRLLPARLLEVVRKGATIALDNVDQLHAPLDELAFNLERQLGATVFINLYASWGPQFGFDVHWDDHDVIVLQVSGQKRWRIWEPTREWPLYRDIDSAPMPDREPVMELVLEEGDVLHVPRGWWHIAEADAGPSLHITVGIDRPTVMDLVNWLVDGLRADVEFRKPLLRDSPRENGAYLRHIIEESIRQRLDRGDFIQEYLQFVDGRSRAHSCFSLPYDVGDGPLAPFRDEAAITVLFPRATLEQREDGSAVLGANGRRWSFAPRAMPVLRHLLSRRRQLVSELVLQCQGSISPSDVKSLLAVLVEGGVIAVASV